MINFALFTVADFGVQRANHVSDEGSRVLGIHLIKQVRKQSQVDHGLVSRFESDFGRKFQNCSVHVVQNDGVYFALCDVIVALKLQNFHDLVNILNR